MNHKNFVFTLVLIFTRCLEIAVHNVELTLISYSISLQTNLISSSNFTSLSFLKLVNELLHFSVCLPYMSKRPSYCTRLSALQLTAKLVSRNALQKGGVPATPSGTATLLRLSPSHQFCPRTLLAVTYFRHPRLPWLDGRCVQGPGTYSPRHG